MEGRRGKLGIRHPEREGQRKNDREKGRQSESHTHPLCKRQREKRGGEEKSPQGTRDAPTPPHTHGHTHTHHTHHAGVADTWERKRHVHAHL